MKKSKLITVLVSLLVFSLVGSAFVSFSSGSDDGSIATPFDAMVELGFMTDLEREDYIKRIDALEMLLAVTAQKNNSPSDEALSIFIDADQDHVLYAIETGLILGNGILHFSPNRPITLEEMLIMALRVLGYWDVSSENVYDYAEQAQIYTHTEQDDLYFYLNAGRMAEILWNMLFATPATTEGASYSDLLIELGEMDEAAFSNVLGSINYSFGDITDARTGVLEDDSFSTVEPEDSTVEPEDSTSQDDETTSKEPEESSTPGIDDDDGWSPIWRPGKKSFFSVFFEKYLYAEK